MLDRDDDGAVEISDLEEDFEREITCIKLSKPLGADYAGQPKIYAFTEEASVFGSNAPDWRSLPSSTKMLIPDCERLG